MSTLKETKSFEKSEEELDLIAQTQSFWDIGNYRKVVRRIDDGAKLCSELVKMIQERADIESKYAKHLRQWSKKWDESVNKGPEYGTLENGWKSLALEASRQADIHEEICKKVKDIAKKMAEWRAQHYHKAISGQWKEAKRADEGFNRAQKPWSKNLSRCNKAKKAYHNTSKELDSVTLLLSNAETNYTETTLEQIQKLREKKEKTEKEKEKNLEKYKDRLIDVVHYKNRYVEDMKREFDKCQEFEKARIEFFKEILMTMKTMIDMSKDERIPCIYQVCSHTLSLVSPDDDLQWYSQHYGPDMSYSWPEFEEYCSKSDYPENSDPQTQTSPSVNENESCQSLEESRPSLEESQLSLDEVNTDDTHIYERTDWEQHSSSHASEETGDEHDPNFKRDIEEEGVLMRAMYDYVGVEDDDDLSFQEGDVVLFVEYCDGGWVKALLGDQYGYVPESYFEPVQ